MQSRIASSLARRTLAIAGLAVLASASRAADYYVDAVHGDNADTGASPDHAWRTITRAIAALPALPTGAQERIHVAPGVYDTALGEVFPYPIMFHDGIEIIGDGGSDVTIIDGSQEIVLSGGTAISTLIGSGGAEIVSSGGLDSGSVIGSSGTETVLAGGSARLTTVSGGTQVSMSMAPNALIGTASITESGTDQLSYKAARKRKTNKMENMNI